MTYMMFEIFDTLKKYRGRKEQGKQRVIYLKNFCKRVLEQGIVRIIKKKHWIGRWIEP